MSKANTKKIQVVESIEELGLEDNKESDNQRLPSILDETPKALEKRLKRIEEHLTSIADKQSSGVSAEFNALMDGYVNKANQSQEFKVKYENIESQFADIKLELRTLREENRKYKSDLDASKEALRASEADLQRHKRDTENSRLQFEEQVSNLVEERERLKTKVKQLMDHKEKSSSDYNELKSELLEYKYKAKQLEQEKQVEIETARRTVRESTKIVDELKEKLDLRTREVEYKDALLNQLIKQVSTDESMDAVLASGNYQDLTQEQNLDPMQNSNWKSIRN